MATVKRIVKHPKLYIKVNGKLTHVMKGTELEMSESEAARLKDKLYDLSNVDKIKLTPPAEVFFEEKKSKRGRPKKDVSDKDDDDNVKDDLIEEVNLMDV